MDIERIFERNRACHEQVITVSQKIKSQNTIVSTILTIDSHVIIITAFCELLFDLQKYNLKSI